MAVAEGCGRFLELVSGGSLAGRPPSATPAPMLLPEACLEVLVLVAIGISCTIPTASSQFTHSCSSVRRLSFTNFSPLFARKSRGNKRRAHFA